MRGDRPVRVGIRCDADVRTGVGHLIRCIALAEELLGRSVEVVFLSRIDDVGWATRQLSSRGLMVVPPASAAADLARQALDLGLAAVVLDGYELDPDTGKALRDSGVVVLDILDGEFGRQDADLYMDQNLGAERMPFDGPSGSVRLAGLRYALLRNVVREGRPSAPRPAAEHAVVDILAFFGGTDAHSAAPVIVPLLLQTGVVMQVRVVAGRPELARQLAGLSTGAGQDVEVLEPTEDLPRLAASSALVVCASGTSLWEMLCVGAPSAVLAVTQNQEIGYQSVVAEDLAVGLGRLDLLRADETARAEVVRNLTAILTYPERRAALSARGWSLVDGLGRERVADALLGVTRTV